MVLNDRKKIFLVLDPLKSFTTFQHFSHLQQSFKNLMSFKAILIKFDTIRPTFDIYTQSSIRLIGFHNIFFQGAMYFDLRTFSG